METDLYLPKVMAGTVTGEAVMWKADIWEA